VKASARGCRVTGHPLTGWQPIATTSKCIAYVVCVYVFQVFVTIFMCFKNRLICFVRGLTHLFSSFWSLFVKMNLCGVMWTIWLINWWFGEWHCHKLTAHSGRPMKWHAWYVATARGSACASAKPRTTSTQHRLLLSVTQENVIAFVTLKLKHIFGNCWQ